MSSQLPFPQKNYDDGGLAEDDIQVTSPTSYALRESIRRSSSSSFDFGTSTTIRTPSNNTERQGNRLSRGGSFFNRAPPPAPPQHPPAVMHQQMAPNSSSSTSGGMNGMARPSSNPSLAAMGQSDYPQHGNSLGPMSFSTTPMGSSSLSASYNQNSSSSASNVNNNNGPSSGPGHRRSSSRRSIFSRETFMLSREKESPATIPEGVPLEIKCEGFLTKRGHVFTTWKTRYFVLRGNVLEYFAGEDKGKRYGSVTVAKVAPWSGEAHGFMFYTTKQIPYYVYAASEAERSKWLRALKEFVVEPEEVSCEGYLTRRGHLVPSQRMAYYVLNGTSLRHYADQSAYRDNQSAIAEVEVRSIAPWDGEANGLMFQTSTGNVFYANTDTLGEQQKWIQTVKKSNATAPEPVSCAGYLTKQGHKRKSWKKRYFILRGNLIAYYPDYDLANSAKGRALAEVTVEDVQKWDGEPFGFMFMTSEQVPYYVYADNDRERNKWMNALRKLTTVAEEPTSLEKKRCPNCNAVLTGSRFCGACGHNLRGTTIGGDRSGNNGSRRNQTGRSSVGDDSQDDPEMDDDNAFDELEALSEGARTLLLAVMQTPEGVDIGGDRDSAFPSRVAKSKIEHFPVQPKLEVEIPESSDDIQIEELQPTVSPISTPASPSARLAPQTIAVSEIADEDDEDALESPPQMTPSPPTPPASRTKKTDSKFESSRTPEPEPRATLTPNFAIVEDGETKNSSFTSFGGDSDEESKAEPQPVPVPARKSSRASGVHMAGMGRRKTLGQLAAESSSDEEGETKLPTKPPTMAYAKGEEEDESKQEEEGARGRKSSADSLELDTRGIALMEETSDRPDPRPSIRMSERSAKKDLYHYMERELDFTPQFIPSADAPVRCRFYSSMAYASAKKVIMFISDSGPLGLWKQDLTDQTTTTDHKWAMVRYFSRAQEEGYGVIVCNPFSNSVVVYEAGGFERTVPIPNSSTPKEHVLFVWEQFVTKCKGQVSIVAFARGGALVKSILETHETSAREKIHRVAFIESKHEIDPTESFGIRELLGSRSINWEASFEPLGGQIVDSQARVGCVCLSIGYMPDNRLESDNDPRTLEKSEDPAFAFVGANPDRPGMTAVVRHVRAELRKVRKNGKTMNVNNKQRRHSNIVILGETDANESSDLSTGDGDEKPTTPAASSLATGVDEKGKPNYYLPKPIPKPARSPSPGGNSGSSAASSASSRESDRNRQAVTDTDFELMKVVGQGGFGKVFLCRKTTAPHKDECYAMKVLKKQHVVSSGLVNTTMAERRILTEISHPFIVKLHYAFQSQSKLYLVMDYLSGGSLAFHLRRRRKFPEDWARFYAAEVGAAIAHLHSVNIIYRDAKLENVLMDHEGHVRITDFGLSKIGVSDLKGATTFCGTAAYIAPELLKGNTYGKAADWWSFGILLYEMIGGKPPYYHRNRDIMFQTILKQEWVTFSPNFSDAAISLIRGLLTRDPMQRLGSGRGGADEVLNHPFFDEINWRDLLEKKVAPPFNPGVGKLDTHYAPRHNNEITARDREASMLMPTNGGAMNNEFDGFSFVGRPSSLSMSGV